MLAVHRRDRNGELLWVDLRQLGNVLSILTSPVGQHLPVHALDTGAEAAEVGNSEVPRRGAVSKRRTRVRGVRKLDKREILVMVHGIEGPQLGPFPQR